MILSRVELINFKSFADKTTFDFSSGITAILGPNGCGKSNVVDAIKWVLGEQNPRTLRGEEMTDVIFAGSENRRPTGMAEVSLYFDNSNGQLPTEYNEVCITRRLYRSGESEYLINKNPCRLRDIRELFMDTGIGTSAYTVIEQGKVEALLSAKPHERRLVFEEAAGISKYKARRKEALSRLERTDQNLLRSTDIVEEIEKRIRSLSRQASNARRFQNLADELRTAKGRYFTARWTTERDKLQELRSQIGKLEVLHREEAARNGNLNNEISELQNRELGMEAEIETATGQLRKVEQETSAIESEKVRTEEQLKALEREGEQREGTLESLRLRTAAMETEKGKLTTERQALTEEVETL
ncbi:MAG: AAA family ATPase, partial [Planctomycetes bacterium]|nr:AAA family ATPase [Planctomycetota bacterium]